MNHLELYKERTQSELDKIGAEIRKLKATAEAAGAEQRVRFVRYVSELEDRCEDLGDRLDSIKSSGEDAAADLSRGLKDARDRLAIAKRAAKARFH